MAVACTLGCIENDKKYIYNYPELFLWFYKKRENVKKSKNFEGLAWGQAHYKNKAALKFKYFLQQNQGLWYSK